MTKRTKYIAFAGMIGALYYVLTVFLAPISYGEIQCRISELLLFMCMENPFAIIGVTIGCALANLASPIGIIDVVFGASCNFVVGCIAYKTKSLVATVISGALINGIVIGLELHYIYQLPIIITMASVAAGEFISLLIGAGIYKYMRSRVPLGNE